MLTSIPVESLSLSAEMAWGFLTLVASLVSIFFLPRG
jgi:hypothetical protein